MTPFEQAVRGAALIAGRLRRSMAAVGFLGPLDATRMVALDDAGQDACDAFLKRFESLVAQLQDQVWPQAMREEGEDPTGLTRRMVAEFMDRLGLVPDARAMARVNELRNVLAHAYPLEPARQAQLLTEALRQCPLLLDCVARAERYLAERRGSAGEAC